MGAEVCELVGPFLNKIEDLVPQQDVGLYRDDGLAVTSLPGPEIKRPNKSPKKKTFKYHGLINSDKLPERNPELGKQHL